MSTAEAPAKDPLTVADACGNHKVELAEAQMQQQVLKCTIAAQQKLETIRGEYADLRSLVYRIRELRVDRAPSRSQRSLLDDLIRQQESVDDLATSLTCLLD
jgi:hypothetical protein